MKQTAVEFLVDKLSYTTSDGIIISHHKFINKLVQQAKEMEKEQIKDAYNFGIKDEYVIGAEQYYNETFKSEEDETDSI